MDAVGGAFGLIVFADVFEEIVQFKTLGVFGCEIISGKVRQFGKIAGHFIDFMVDDVQSFDLFVVFFALPEDSQEIFDTGEGFFHIVGDVAEEFIAFGEDGFKFAGADLDFGLQIFFEVI